MPANTVRANFLQQCLELGGLAGIHARRGFIECQQHRIGGQGARDFGPALVTVREILGQHVRLPGDADVFQQLIRARGDRRLFGTGGGITPDRTDNAGMGAHVSPDHDVLKRRHVGEQTDVLECARHTQRRHLIWLAPRDLPSLQFNATGIRSVYAGHNIE